MRFYRFGKDGSTLEFNAPPSGGLFLSLEMDDSPPSLIVLDKDDVIGLISELNEALKQMP